MAKARSQYRCSQCHHVTAKWVGRCLACGTWGTVDEVALLSAVRGTARRSPLQACRALPISAIEPHHTHHCPTGVGELDRVLGGGVVPGSVTLLAGDPGVGKSTLLLKVAHRWAQAGGARYTSPVRNPPARSGCGPTAPVAATTRCTWRPNPICTRCWTISRRWRPRWLSWTRSRLCLPPMPTAQWAESPKSRPSPPG
ncbi:kaiC family protein [Mycobacterium xenopi 4042]|uniref:KaiC family protein n=1 Tax=Mycobacterium xenopi 4042 TaxID=1299334 RepID=X7ZUU8_MYCXE|nr:kaiC family protein [Mycobacterium xenopi 4042]